MTKKVRPDALDAGLLDDCMIDRFNSLSDAELSVMSDQGVRKLVMKDYHAEVRRSVAYEDRLTAENPFNLAARKSVKGLA